MGIYIDNIHCWHQPKACSGDVILVGISHDREAKVPDCLIEKM